MSSSSNIWSFIRSGALSGAMSAFVFAFIHYVFISNIWWSMIIMMIAGAICGLCVGWSYGQLFEKPSTRSWLQYNFIFLGMFVLLGAASVLVFEPVTSLAAVVVANEPVDDLILQALPMTLFFTVACAILLSLLYGRKWGDYVAILMTCVVLVLFLGLNVSAIGLVQIPTGSLYLILELFGLILALNLAYVAVFILLERKRLVEK